MTKKYHNGNHLFVERAIAELRASRLVRLCHAEGEAVVLSVDALDSPLVGKVAEQVEDPTHIFERLMHPYGKPTPEKQLKAEGAHYEVRLILSGARLQKLGVSQLEPGVLLITQQNIGMLPSLAFGPHEKLK